MVRKDENTVYMGELAQFFLLVQPPLAKDFEEMNGADQVEAATPFRKACL